MKTNIDMLAVALKPFIINKRAKHVAKRIINSQIIKFKQLLKTAPAHMSDMYQTKPQVCVQMAILPR